MKSNRSFINSNPLLSYSRIVIAGTLVIAAVAMAAVALKTSSPPVAARGHQPMSLRMASRETLDPSSTVAGAPQYHIFTCQRGLSVGACYDPFQMRRAYQTDSLIPAGYDGT